VRPKEWLAFGSLGLIWGSSFLWIKVAVQDIAPFSLVAWRLLFGFLGLATVVLLLRPAFPKGRKVWLWIALLGLTNTLLPFALITWGEQHVDSAVAAVLNGTVPLFTMLIAHWFLHDDRITLPRLAGLALGFIGVIVLMAGDIEIGSLTNSLWGQVAVLLAAVSYAVSAVLARKKLVGVRPLAQSFAPMLFATSYAWGVAALAEGPEVPSLPLSWIALLWLGLLGSCVAYLLFYYLLNNVGPTRTTLVTYIFPVVGLILGVVFLGETLDLALAVGAGLIFAGIAIVNLRSRRTTPAPGLPSKI
jgi:drug/metabolite transporter (DMT)-like permease